MSSAANSGLSGLRRNTRNARWLGVCAGIADWLDVPATLVRIVFVICVLTWPTLIIGYFILYFCLSKDIDAEKVKDYVNGSNIKSHFQKLNYRKPIYKNQSDKRIAGVCSGIADYLEISPFTVRIITFGSLFVFGPFTFWAYVICAFVFDPDPLTMDSDRYAQKMAKRDMRRQKRHRFKEQRAQSRAKRRGYSNSYVNEEYAQPAADGVAQDCGEDNLKETVEDSKSSLNQEECAKLYRILETRLRGIEAYMTSKQFRLHCEINRI